MDTGCIPPNCQLFSVHVKHIRAFFRTQESKIVKEIILLVFLSRKEQTNRSANIFSSVLKGFEAQTIVLLIVSKILQQQEKQT
ncbi:hypothetical protein CLI78_09175 [Porphyromonas gingivalis]|nr:hypothetical protein CLI78_09175 [Porphyromonas gingivalis]